MRSRGGRPIATLGLCILSVLSLATLSSAQTWFESYHDAQEALEKGEWSEAIRHLNAALEEKPSSSAQARTYGMRFIAYFPFYELGIAYLNLGQLDAALQAFETEERQGEIQKSQEDYSELLASREDIAQRRAQRETERRQRAEEVAQDNLEEAQRLESEGRLGEALDAIGKTLAVAPDHAVAQSTRRRLLDLIAARQHRLEAEARVAALIEQGKANLTAGEYRSAAMSFAKALELDPDDETVALLERAQQAVRDSVEQRHERDVVAGSLERAKRLEAAGDLRESLNELQAVLAIDPENREARARQQRIFEAELRAEQDERIEDLLGQAEMHLDRREFGQALRIANRVLALEPANGTALQYIARSYTGLNDALLATENSPPSLVFDESRTRGAESDSIKVVRSPDFVLTGTVYDDTPVELSVGGVAGEAVDLSVQSRELLGVWITDFSLQYELPSGLTTLELTAVDQGGEKTVATYSVDYVVPFAKSLWFPASAGGLLAGLGLALVGSRAHRRRKLRQQRFNPYVAGAPILEHNKFFGRQELMEYVLRRIHNNSILLYGERRIGKTSFQHQLKNALLELDDPEHEFFPVFIDLQGTPEERFFATMASEIFDELEPRLEGLEPNPALDSGSYGYREFVKDIHGVLKCLKGKSSKRTKLVLLIDEVDELNDYDPRVNQKLRSLFMRTFADSLVSVVSGVAIKKHWEREGSPWYNFFQEIEVQPLDTKEAVALIETPVRGVFTFADGVVEEILRRTSGKPYLIQRICGRLVDRGHKEQRRSLTMTDLETVCAPEGL